MDALPPQKFQPRPWRFGRKRRRSGTEATESEGKLIFLTFSSVHEVYSAVRK